MIERIVKAVCQKNIDRGFWYSMSEKNRNIRILRNSFWLYLRMILSMGIALFSSRILLNALGVEDFGILNWLITLINMFLFFYWAVSNVLQRFLNILIEQKNVEKAQNVFSMVVIFTVIATAVVMSGEFFFCEWILTHKLKIAAANLPSTRFLFYCLLIAIFFQTSAIPWKEAILAKEKMDFYAILTLSGSMLKLILTLFLFFYIPVKKMEFYGIGFITINLFYWLAAIIYCGKEIPEAHFRFVWKRNIGKEILPFFSYTMLGGTLSFLSFNGLVVLLGIFFSPAANAAYAIAGQIRDAVSQLSLQFSMAIKPQMIQAHAEKNMEYVRRLFFSSSKLSYFALLFVVTPILIELPYLLKLWLKTIPEYTVEFSVLLLIGALIAAITAVFALINLATGMNKGLETTGRFITLAFLGLVYIAMKLGISPRGAVAISILGELATAVYWLWDIKGQIQISFFRYLKNVVWVVSVCSLISWGILFFIKAIFPGEGFLKLVILSTLSLIVNFLICFFLGTTREEKKYLSEIVFFYRKRLSLGDNLK